MKKFIILFLFLLTIFNLSAKNIYVREGNNGDGTISNPYGYLWIALFGAEPGDVIHITEGYYRGRDSAGVFAIDKTDITIAGGYNHDFTERNPFLYSTILEQIEDYNGISKPYPIRQMLY